MSEPFDESAKLFYSRLFAGWGLRVKTEQEVFHRGRTIDLVVDCPDDERNRLSETVFAHFRRQNAIEFKGYQDPLNLKNYNRIMMRVWALGGMDKKKGEGGEGQENSSQIVRHPSERAVTIVCVTRPDKILSDTRLGFERTDAPGIYRYNGQLPVWIINPTELALIPANYPLLSLTKGEKLEQFIDLCLDEGLTGYLQLILDVGLAIDPNTIWKKIVEATQMNVKIREETWPYIDRFFRQMPEAFRKLPTFQDALDEKGRQSQKIGLQKGQEIGLQKGQEIGQEVGALHNQQRILIRQLQRKFPDAPESVIQRISATESIELLDEWLDQILAANELADIELG